MSETQQAAGPAPPPRKPWRRSRLGLYAPFLALAALAVAWSVGWAVVRSRTATGLDAWLAAEAAAGRRWTCVDRSIGGYPFRIELRCAALSLERPGAVASFGSLLVVSQVYQPRHVVAEVGGPLRATVADAEVEGTWRLGRVSVILAERGFDRASASVEDSTLTVRTAAAGALPLTSRRLEAHVRPSPGGRAAYDANLRLAGATIPGLDWLIGGAEAADADLTLAVTEAADVVARPVPAELDRWREAGGKVEIARLALAKGPRRVDGRGSFGLDSERRPAGELQLAASGLEGALGRVFGDRAAFGGLVGALLGQPRAQPAAPAATPNAPALRSLPPVRLEGGRVLVGPLALPGVRLPPLF